MGDQRNMTPMHSFVDIDGKRFELGSASLELYHCDSVEADWNLALDRPAHDGQTMWLAGTASPSPRCIADLDGSQLRIEGRDLDGLFEALLGVPITTYPSGQSVCSASFLASVVEGGVSLVSDFWFDWDRYLDPPDVTYPEPRRARLDIFATIAGLHDEDLPGS